MLVIEPRRRIEVEGVEAGPLVLAEAAEVDLQRQRPARTRHEGQEDREHRARSRRHGLENPSGRIGGEQRDRVDGREVKGLELHQTGQRHDGARPDGPSLLEQQEGEHHQKDHDAVRLPPVGGVEDPGGIDRPDRGAGQPHELPLPPQHAVEERDAREVEQHLPPFEGEHHIGVEGAHRADPEQLPRQEEGEEKKGRIVKVPYIVISAEEVVCHSGRPVHIEAQVEIVHGDIGDHQPHQRGERHQHGQKPANLPG